MAKLNTFAGYETIEKLGEGGMCAVFRVRHIETGEECAIKILTDTDEQAGERFKEEAQLLMQIHHENIIEVHHLEDSDPPWLAMEMLTGRDLDEVREERGAIDPERAALIFAAVASGLELVHQMGVRHRDIKPANIMLSADEVPHLIDFGIARDTSQAHKTRQGFVVGTAAYMPPEIFMEDDPNLLQDSACSDVYSLGMSLCEVLTGQLIHSRGGAGTTQMVQIIKDKMDRPHLDPREWLPTVPDGLAEVVKAATTQEPDDRIQTALEFQERLTAWVTLRQQTGTAPVNRGDFDLSALPTPVAPPKSKPSTVIDDLKQVPHAIAAEPASTSPPTPPVNPPNEPRPRTPPPPDSGGGGRLGAVFGAAGSMTVAGLWLAVALVGVVVLYVMRPVAPPVQPDHAKAIRTVIHKAPTLKACQGKGKSKLDLQVANGKATTVLMEPKLDDPLDTCIRDAIASLKFPEGPETRVRMPISVR
jgi:serine/threonine protein kinase